MGFFSTLFGSAGDAYSSEARLLSEHEIKLLVSRSQIQTLTNEEEALVEHAIAGRRKGDGMISLRQIDEALRKLESAKKISKHDRLNILKVFKDNFVSPV